MFRYTDIQWIRNVKHEGGENGAYFDDDKDEMILHWSSSYVNQPTHAMKPKVGDIVVLFQKFNNDDQVYFTHLLTPKDSVEKDCLETSPKHRWGRKMIVLARTKKIIKPLNFNLKSVNQGHTYPIGLCNKNATKEDVQKIIWDAFNPFFRKDVSSRFIEELSSNFLVNTLDEFEGEEGKWNFAMHRYRERDNSLIRKKKVSVKNPICECCNFDFSKFYPNHGNGFIECHHKTPISKGERITKLEDLALVYANCHRMLHRKNNQQNYYTVEELKEIISNE
ncbi:HNH endonuclease [Wenyingzhuangia sp. 2_MG-2023]|uniref:HNH endonuclease n=1 Tax=Wenyingzhuangia sp. 2_MG-2023 TaxID=3062639 RepID=UPI0026E15CDC|nr:HNH endonuclease [Wenyingzhuangia sp. 2_MG-2023]MDO6737369.1 HNH endonuclease [Wenyingzhuangia sp. 2_MG-2023]